MTARATSRTVRQGSGGFTYLGILFAIVILGFALAAAGTLWSISARRDREAQLLWVGNQYRHAIASYYLKGPAGLRQFPPSLEELLEDRRGSVLLRHLRKLYPDPMTGSANWALERAADGSILGVRSTAQGQPIKQAGFAPELAAFAGAACYCDWIFLYVPSRATALQPTTL
jgi:type II secretory pathway pseudopilin PulG